MICTRVVCCPSRTQRWMFHPSATPEQQGCRAPVTTVLVKTLLYTYIRRGDIVLRTIYTYNVRAYDLTHHLFFIFNITSWYSITSFEFDLPVVDPVVSFYLRWERERMHRPSLPLSIIPREVCARAAFNFRLEPCANSLSSFSPLLSILLSFSPISLSLSLSFSHHFSFLASYRVAARKLSETT